MKVFAALGVAIVAVAVSASAGGAVRVASVCSGDQLAGTFKVIPGSAGAGNIVYRLSVTNKSTTTCSLTGLPVVKLYGRTGKLLPTRTIPAFRPGLTAVLVMLAPNGWAHATARFSPDVPGPGETGMQCEPKAYSVHVTTRSGGTARVPVKPATPVCEHGQLQLSVYSPGR